MDKIDVLVNFGIELVATGVGAFLGYLVGLNQDRKGRESEDDESKRATQRRKCDQDNNKK